METYWKFILIGAGILILGIIGLILGVPKTILKNKTARDVAKWLGIILTVLGVIILIIGAILYFRKKSKYKMIPQYGMTMPQGYAYPQQQMIQPQGYAYPQQGYAYPQQQVAVQPQGYMYPQPR